MLATGTVQGWVIAALIFAGSLALAINAPAVFDAAGRVLLASGAAWFACCIGMRIYAHD